MKYFSMFSGIGGFELGIKKATNNEWECIGFSEIDKHAEKTYKTHFKEHRNYGDATKISPEQLPDFDIICGGFPCQAFSIAGKRMGFEDTRGTLFFDIARIIKIKRPRIVFLENVKGLLNHAKGRTFTTIIATLDELGYNVEWQVLNSKHFGVPQNRERVFIIGHIRGSSGQQIFPLRKNNQEFQEKGRRKKTISESNISGTLRAQYYKNSADATYINEVKIGTNRTFKDDKGFREMKSGVSPTITSKEPVIKTHSLMPRSGNPNQGGTGHLSKADGNTYCVDTGNSQGIELDNRIRRLTPTECERLQGFPDNWTIGSDTQRYKQCGNAVTVNVIEAIVKELMKVEI